MSDTAVRPAEASPPGPKGIPVFGCLGELRRNPMRFFARTAQTYGGIARIPLGRRHVFLVSEPALLHELLVVKRHKYMKNIRYTEIQKLVGLGLLLSEGADWQRQRQISQPEYTPRAVNATTPWMADLIAGFLEPWSSRADSGRAFDVEPEFFRLAQLIAGESILGPRFHQIADRFCDYATILKNSWPRSPRTLLGLLMAPLLQPLTNRKLARFGAALAESDALLYRFLARCRERGFEDCGVVTRIARTSTEQGEPYSDERLRDQIMTIFYAGHETTATSLSWIHYLLSIHPEARDRLTAEVDRVLGDRVPTAEDLKQLTYTERVIKESLRLYSPIHSLSRVAIEDNRIGGYLIVKGSTVVVSLFATHRLPQYWPDPERFDPDRFTAEKMATLPQFAYIPFAAGHRNCIGGSMAILELKLIVSQLAQRFRLDHVPGHRIELEAGTTMYPRYGMKMTLRRAKAAA